MAQPTIDPATFKALQDTAGADFVVELVQAFLEEAPVMLADLHAALAAGDADKFRRSAHSLKSNGLTFGAIALAASARELELGGLALARETGALRLDELGAEYSRVASALAELARA